LIVDGDKPLAGSDVRVAELVDVAAFGNRIANLDDPRTQSLSFIDRAARCLVHRTGTKRCDESRNDHDPAWGDVANALQPRPALQREGSQAPIRANAGHR